MSACCAIWLPALSILKSFPCGVFSETPTFESRLQNIIFFMPNPSRHIVELLNRAKISCKENDSSSTVYCESIKALNLVI